MTRFFTAAALVLPILFSAAGSPAAAAVEVQRVVSPGGIVAWLVAEPSNPLIAIRFAFRGGAALDPDGKEGLADFMSGLLDEGAGDLESQDFQRRLEDLAVRLRFNAGRDAFHGDLQTLTENRHEAVRLLGLALSAPRFDSEPVARIRGQMIARHKRDQEKPNLIASRRLREILFPDHPYGRPVRGTIESLRAIGADDLRQFLTARLSREALFVGVVGDTTPEDLGPLLDQAFGGLPDRSAPGTVRDVTPQSTGDTVVVPLNVPQSAIVFAHAGIRRHHPDFYAAFVLNHILGGGGFTSRLYREAREKRGLTYSIYSSLVPMDHAGLLWGGAATQNERVAETLDVVRNEWRRLAEGALDDQELTDAKSYLTGSFPLRFSSNRRVAHMLVSLQLDGLGRDYLEKRNDLIEQVNKVDVIRAARELLKPERLTAVVVGQPEGLKGATTP